MPFYHYLTILQHLIVKLDGEDAARVDRSALVTAALLFGLLMAEGLAARHNQVLVGTLSPAAVGSKLSREERIT